MELQSLLRKLVLVEVVFCVMLIAIGLADEPFLPGSLKAPIHAQLDGLMLLPDWILLPFDLLVLCLGILAWVGLWRGWRSGRQLYVVQLLLSLSLLVLYGPSISSGVSGLLESSGTIVSGLILGVLYFSDLRHRYERPVAA